MNQYVGVFRNEEGLQAAAKKVQDIKQRYTTMGIQNKGRVYNTDLITAIELGYMLDIAEAVIGGALTRKESRGAHSRLDYKERDDVNWLKHTLAFSSPEGIRIDTKPVSITKWQPEVRSY